MPKVTCWPFFWPSQARSEFPTHEQKYESRTLIHVLTPRFVELRKLLTSSIIGLWDIT